MGISNFDTNTGLRLLVPLPSERCVFRLNSASCRHEVRRAAEVSMKKAEATYKQERDRMEAEVSRHQGEADDLENEARVSPALMN